MDIVMARLKPATKQVEVTPEESNDFAELYAAQETANDFGVISHETRAARYRTLHKAQAWAAANGLVVRQRRMSDDTTLAIRFHVPRTEAA